MVSWATTQLGPLGSLVLHATPCIELFALPITPTAFPLFILTCLIIGLPMHGCGADILPNPKYTKGSKIALGGGRVCDSQWEAGYLGKLDYFNQALGMGMRGMGILKT